MDCSGPTTEIDTAPPDYDRFSPESGRLEPDCIRHQLRGVSALNVDNGLEWIGPIYGPVELVAGRNVQPGASRDATTTGIRSDAIDGVGLTEDSVCADAVTLPAPIRTISGVAPDTNGNLELVGSHCLQVQPICRGLRLVNTCSEPCCGRPELEALAR